MKVRARPRHTRSSAPSGLRGWVALNPVAFALTVFFVLAGITGLVLMFLMTPPACVEFGPDQVGKKSFEAPPCRMIDDNTVYVAVMQTDIGAIRFTMDPRAAPLSVNNFVFLARTGFYDGTTFHRIEDTPDHALIQAGDPTGTGRGGPGYSFFEYAPPSSQYKRGIVAMATPVNSDRSGSQFFIVVRDYLRLGAPWKMPTNTIFGVLNEEPETYATVDTISTVPIDGTRPLERVVIRRVTIEEHPRF